MTRLLDAPSNIAANLHAHIQGFSRGALDVLEKFDFPTHIDRLDRADLLYLVVSRFCEIDLHPEVVSNLEMGYLLAHRCFETNHAVIAATARHDVPELPAAVERILLRRRDGIDG